MRRLVDGAAIVLFALSCRTSAAHAQQVDIQPSPEKSVESATPADIVVLGKRLPGSAISDVAPIITLDAKTIAATGATTIGELLQTIRGATQSASGAEPIFLLNAQRVSGYPEIGSLPPEAIERVEVLPEPEAIKFGYPPNQRLVNFITKRNFRQVEVKGSAGSTTRAASGTQKVNLGVTRLRKDRRLTLTLEARRTDPVSLAERTILPDPDVPFDAIGNVVGAAPGEIDPALSAVAGFPATVAPVPANAARTFTLQDFASAANRPRLFDPGPLRLLTPRNQAAKAEAVLADRLTKGIAGSLSLSAEQSLDRTLLGPAPIYLTVPAGNPWSPFGRTVRVARYLTEVAPLEAEQKTTTLQAGMTLRGAVSGWQWDFTGAFNQRQVDAALDRTIDTTMADAAIAAGADPFAPLQPSLLSVRPRDVTRYRTRTLAAKSVVTGSPVHMPAGKVTLVATLEADRTDAASSTRGPNPGALNLTRTRLEGGLAVDVPLASRDADVLPWLGKLSVNASARARSVSDVGTLSDATAGLTWEAIKGVQLLASLKRSAAAPDPQRLLGPITRVENVPILDYGTGRTELTTVIQGGNPALLAEERLVRSISVNIKPFNNRELRLTATYEATTIRNQAGLIYALSPLTEALVPELFVRDAAGRLVSAAFVPINFDRQEQRALNVTLFSSGQLGKAPPAPDPTRPAPPPTRPFYYAGIGPSIKFSDRLDVRSGAPALDLIRGDTVTGGGTQRIYGYVYGGLNYRGSGLTFDGWLQGASRVRSSGPAADLHFRPLAKLNAAVFVGLEELLKADAWARKMQVRIDIANLTDARQRVRDENGRTPNRLQPDVLDPVGRVVTLTLRKLL
ncbi:TonB-dependent receptor [Sphingomonas qomolangmaensis]|uniref:TonB-dependent receptor n=1 Tax=Sphingomonas qomolangmaensis TaxID=2918765 RepID=A0ABY5L384_9SPHN|nr:TonB-dependent receptor [Sphingomonas qomolangmaensis]UUL81414.1 TonB-dependent receptor [Sphingomonas qomolangmaensis]